MQRRAKNLFWILQFQKYVGLLLILAGIPAMFLDPTKGSEIPLLVGLFILLIATAKTEDERSVQIKMLSVYIAFIISYAVKLLTTNFFEHGWISFHLVEINHFLILLLAVANSIYYTRLYILKY